ncbi:MAG: hypothetical protein ACOCXD_02075 [Bacteroidota bacterium]
MVGEKRTSAFRQLKGNPDIEFVEFHKLIAVKCLQYLFRLSKSLNLEIRKPIIPVNYYIGDASLSCF